MQIRNAPEMQKWHSNLPHYFHDTRIRPEEVPGLLRRRMSSRVGENDRY